MSANASTSYLRALLNSDDELLVPSPDYPLWSAAVALNHGTPVYYNCRPENGFQPDPDEIRSLITARTRGIVLINPNNPTGAVYTRELLEEIVGIAEEHQIIVFADEITTRCCTTTRSTCPWPRWYTTPVRDIQWPVKNLPGLRLPGRLGGIQR